MSVRESGWVGRMEGMDSTGLSLDADGRKRNKNGQLPPLSADIGDGSMVRLLDHIDGHAHERFN